MRYRKLGNTGLNLSEIGFGCAGFWGKKIFSENDAIRLVHEAAAQGITFFDTGSSYSAGNAELRLGKALASLPNRHDLVIATKVGTRPDRFGRAYKDCSPPWVRKSVEESLRRLRRDAIPLLQLHGPQIEDMNDDLLAVLERMRKEGKVLHFGINSFEMHVIEHVLNVPLFGAVMFDCNILHPERGPLVAKLAKGGIGVLASKALAGGLYGGRMSPIRRPRDVWYRLRALKNRGKDRERGKCFGSIENMDAQIALAWVLRNPDIGCAVIGTTRLSHLIENVSVSGETIDDRMLVEIGKAQQKMLLIP